MRLLCILIFSLACGCTPLDSPLADSGLPLPGSLPSQDYEKQLYRFLMERKYAHWRRDMGVRDTGPYIESQYFGTHPAVRIYYSSQVMRWLENGRKGEIPDGGMIIKEMFQPPAVLYQELARHPDNAEAKDYQAQLSRLVFAWTVMVRDREASRDGWYWANPMAPGEGQSIVEAINSQLDTLDNAPASEFGAPCLRCHSSAEREFTFVDLRNVEGTLPQQEPLRFLVDTSWRRQSHFDTYPLSLLAGDPWIQRHFMLPDPLRPFSEDAGKKNFAAFHRGLTRQEAAARNANAEALTEPNPHFLDNFQSIGAVPSSEVQHFPGQWQDQVLPGAQGAEAFITSDNCLACHGGLGGEPYGVTMFVKIGPNYGDGYNLSEYGEWRWSPMGLAGRDPIFFAQLESEMALLQRDARLEPSPLKGSVTVNQEALTNTCVSCHGAMGQRQLAIDAADDPGLDPSFKVSYLFLKQQLSSSEPEPGAYLKYGQLGREGVSCAICHHIVAPSDQQVSTWQPPAGWLSPQSNTELAYALFHNSTGHFERGPDGELYGPFEDVAEKPMDNVLGVKPAFDAFTQDSRLCGTCHTINLPNIGAIEEEFPVLNAAEQNPAFKDYQHSIEQATFVEWQNSAFARDPGVPGSDFASCQDCHMPRGFESADGSIKIESITTQIAAIQDVNFPEADNRLPVEDIDIPLRDNYRRHEHVGLNVFLLEMFDQFPEILGITKTDYMTSAKNGVDLAIDNMIIQAQQKTADIEVKIDHLDGRDLTASVTVTNKAGHRFPSGVAFRRAFIELLVLDGDKTVWGSGRTNEVGVIVGADGEPLATEFLPDRDTYQHHHQVIDSEQQVQIYEELNQNAQLEFTSSFVHRVHDIKDNRLLPRGWRDSTHFKQDGEVIFEFMEATDPKATGDDPDYMDQGPDFPGRDTVRYVVKLPENVDPARLKVRATLYDQAIPPYWLHQRFTTAPDGEATRRLYYLASHLDLEGTPMEHWKLKLNHAEASYRLNR